MNSQGNYNSTKLLRKFDRFVGKHVKAILQENYPEETVENIITESRVQYQDLLTRLPYIGGNKNPLTDTLVKTAQATALYKAMKARGKSLEEIGLIVDRAQQAYLAVYPRFILRLIGFFGLTPGRWRKNALRSQRKEYLEDWVSEFVPGDGQNFDFGVDYRECAICKFNQAEGVAEFTPYLCKMDFPMMDALGVELTRTKTLAEGADHCDFRFTKKIPKFLS